MWGESIPYRNIYDPKYYNDETGKFEMERDKFNTFIYQVPARGMENISAILSVGTDEVREYSGDDADWVKKSLWNDAFPEKEMKLDNAKRLYRSASEFIKKNREAKDKETVNKIKIARNAIRDTKKIMEEVG